MSTWNKIPFGEILNDSRDGEWGAGEEKAGHQLCNIIRGTDFTVINTTRPELPQRWIKDHLLERKKLMPLDIVFEMAGGTATQSTGRTVLITNSVFKSFADMPLLCASFCRHLRLDQKQYSPHFIYYLLQALYQAGYMAVYNIQHTGVSRFQYTTFKKMTVLDVPSLPIQRKIAAVLSAYDDLIENNNRRIAILEKMAEELYREWFVRLRFPGHEKVKIVKGVPEGWEVKHVAEIIDFLSGYSFKSETYLPAGKHGIVTIKNVQDGYFISECSDFIDVYPSNMKQHCFLKDGDVLMSLTGNVGRVCHVIGNDLLLNQRVAKLQPKIKQASQFIFYTFKNHSMLQLIENLSLGSTAQMNLSPIQLGKQKLLTPEDRLLSFYEQVTLPLHNKTMALLKQNALLTQTRDRLLSRLMSGKIDVEKMDIRFPESMKEEGVAHA